MPSTLSVQDFAQQYKAKNPQYSNMDDLAVAQMVARSYPEWQKKIDFTGVKQESKPVVQTQPKQENKGFFGKIGDIINKGADNLGAITDKYAAGKQGLASSALQTAGEAASALTDIGMEGVKKVTPSFIKEPVKKAVQAVAETQPVKSATEAYSEWKNQHPEAAANLEATVNLASILPTTKAATTGLSVAETAASKAGTVLEKSAAKSASKITDEFAKNLVTPIKTAAVKEAEVARTTEVGRGIFKKSVIEPTLQEKRAIEAVKQVPGVHPDNTFQKNFNIIKAHNEQLANNLVADVKANNFIIPRKETFANLDRAAKTLKDSPLIVGDAELTAKRLLEGAKKVVNDNPGTAEGILQARKDFDAWVKTQKPTLFDAKTEGALTIANREIRNSFNDILEAKAPNIKLKEKLATQHSLYNAMENIVPKAAKEADTAVQRLFQKVSDTLGTKSKVVQATAAMVGVGGLGAAAMFAPIVAEAGIPLYIAYKGGKLMFKPGVRKAAASFLKGIESKLKIATDPIEIQKLNELNSKIKKSFKL